MFHRIVPLLAILCIVIVAIMSFFLWRRAERDPRPTTPPVRESRSQNAELSREHMERAEQYASRAEAAALRAETILETLLLVEARLLKDSATSDAQPPAALKP